MNRNLTVATLYVVALVAFALALVLHVRGQSSIGQMHQRNPAAADITLVNQSAAIGTTNIVGTAPAGIYNVCWVQQITRAASTSSSLLTTIGWNNGSSKTTASFSLNGGLLQLTADITNTLNSGGGNCITVFSAEGQPITFSTSYVSVGATSMQYGLYVTVERLQ